MKFRYFSAALFSMLCFFSTTSYACSCGSYSSFKQAYDDKYTDLVVHAKVLGYLDTSERNPRELVPTLEEGHYSAYVQIQIIDTLKGVSNGPIMTIRGDGGLDCIRYASSFPTGSEWILAIPSNIGGVSNCGESALEVDGKEVLGKHIKDFSKEKKRMKLTKLYKLLGLSKKPVVRNEIKPLT